MKNKKNNKVVKNLINPLFVLIKNNPIKAEIKMKELNRFAHSHANLLDGCMTTESWDDLAGSLNLCRCLSDIAGNNKELVKSLYDEVALDMSGIYTRATDKTNDKYIGKFVYQSKLIGKIVDLIGLFKIDLSTATEGNMYDAYQKMYADQKRADKLNR